VQHNGTQAFVYVVKTDGTVAVQPVTLLASENDETAVDGLAAGVEVATNGFDRLEAGAHVTVRTPKSGSTTGGGTSAGGTAAP
jgi:multidrug efflux system membrane fusion protein